jgi:hypothetical protein
MMDEFRGVMLALTVLWCENHLGWRSYDGLPDLLWYIR